MKLSYYPTLSKAFKFMLANNVASSTLLKKIFKRVNDYNLEPVGIFDRVELELSKLSELELEFLAAGDKDFAPEVSKEAEELLTALFEMIG